jgi:hypothetical protein
MQERTATSNGWHSARQETSLRRRNDDLYAVFAVTEEIGISFAAGLIAGIGKEIYEQAFQKGTPNFAVLIATALGAGLPVFYNYVAS